MCLALFSEVHLLSADIDKALSIFNELRKQDPYRIENMDTFSNLLYVRVSCFSSLDLIKLIYVVFWGHLVTA